MSDKTDSSSELDFNSDDYSSFFYTNDRQIKNMDDEFILSKITEKYPDFSQDRKENVLKQTFTLFVYDSRHIKHILDFFDITIMDLFKIVYRSYPFIFNTCFTNKMHDVVKNKCYAKRTRTKM